MEDRSLALAERLAEALNSELAEGGPIPDEDCAIAIVMFVDALGDNKPKLAQAIRTMITRGRTAI